VTTVFPSIPPPAPDLQSLAASVNALKQSVEILANPGQNKAVRYSDLSTVTYKIDSYIQTNNALVEQLSQIVSSPDSTLAELQTTVAALDARVTVDELAISDNTGNTASLTATVSTLNSSVSSQATAVSGINGVLSARYAVTVTAGNKVTGISLLADNSSATSFNVQADKFNIWASGYSDTPVFAFGTINGVASLTIDGNKVADLSLLTNGVANNAITNSAGATGAGTSGMVSITVRPGARVLAITTYEGGDVTASPGGNLQLAINSTAVATVLIPNSNAGAFFAYYGQAAMAIQTFTSGGTATAQGTASVGTHNVTVYIQELAK
jgi:hypothetical protein